MQVDDKGVGRETVYYIFDKNTENTAKITSGTEITFIADGVKLIEVK